MENTIIYGLTNKKNQRLYSSSPDLVNNGFHKGHLSEFLNKKRKSINGYTDLIGFEELNQGYDTLVFNSRGIERVNVLGEFIRAKDIALLENKDYIHSIEGSKNREKCLKALINKEKFKKIWFSKIKKK